MRFRPAMLALLFVALGAVSVAAQPPSGAREVVRDGICKNYRGLAFAFCVAMCEARQCDHRPSNDERCATLRSGFERATGGGSVPCDVRSPGVGVEPL